jgi:hypothetical protein
MAYRRNPFIFIPIVLTVAVLIIAPKTVEQHEIKGIFIVLMAIGFPWFLFYIISRGVQHMLDEQRRRSQANENHDFV